MLADKCSAVLRRMASIWFRQSAIRIGKIQCPGSGANWLPGFFLHVTRMWDFEQCPEAVSENKHTQGEISLENKHSQTGTSFTMAFLDTDCFWILILTWKLVTVSIYVGKSVERILDRNSNKNINNNVEAHVACFQITNVSSVLNKAKLGFFLSKPSSPWLMPLAHVPL